MRNSTASEYLFSVRLEADKYGLIAPEILLDELDSLKPDDPSPDCFPLDNESSHNVFRMSDEEFSGLLLRVSRLIIEEKESENNVVLVNSSVRHPKKELKECLPTNEESSALIFFFILSHTEMLPISASEDRREKSGELLAVLVADYSSRPLSIFADEERGGRPPIDDPSFPAPFRQAEEDKTSGAPNFSGR